MKPRTNSNSSKLAKPLVKKQGATGGFLQNIGMQKKRLFGVHWSHGGCSPVAQGFLRNCFDWIEKPEHIDTEGIYRKSGDAAKLHKLRDIINKAPKDFLFDNDEDVHCVTGIIKAYFREMPEPLIPFDLYGPCLAASGSPPELRTAMISQVLSLLPPPNRTILSALCSHLSLIVSHSNSNLMNQKNISIVFAPNLLRPRKETVETVLGDAQYSFSLIQSLVENPSTYFPDLIVQDQITETAPTRARGDAIARAPFKQSVSRHGSFESDLDDIANSLVSPRGPQTPGTSTPPKIKPIPLPSVQTDHSGTPKNNDELVTRFRPRAGGESGSSFEEKSTVRSSLTRALTAKDRMVQSTPPVQAARSLSQTSLNAGLVSPRQNIEPTPRDKIVQREVTVVSTPSASGGATNSTISKPPKPVPPPLSMKPGFLTMKIEVPPGGNKVASTFRPDGESQTKIPLQSPRSTPATRSGTYPAIPYSQSAPSTPTGASTSAHVNSAANHSPSGIATALSAKPGVSQSADRTHSGGSTSLPFLSSSAPAKSLAVISPRPLGKVVHQNSAQSTVPSASSHQTNSSNNIASHKNGATIQASEATPPGGPRQLRGFAAKVQSNSNLAPGSVNSTSTTATANKSSVQPTKITPRTPASQLRTRQRAPSKYEMILEDLEQATQRSYTVVRDDLEKLNKIRALISQKQAKYNEQKEGLKSLPPQERGEKEVNINAQLKDLQQKFVITEQKQETLTDKLKSITAKLEDLNLQRTKLMRQGRTFSIAKPKPVGTTTPQQVQSPATEELPDLGNIDKQTFETAFEELWSAFREHTAPGFLEEAQSKQSRGFWIVKFPSPQSVVETWEKGKSLPEAEYIAEGADAGHTSNFEEFAKLVQNYDTTTSVCFIMTTLMKDGTIVSSWDVTSVEAIQR